MVAFFKANPGLSSRIAHHIDFPDYEPGELLSIADLMLGGMQYRLSPGAREASSSTASSADAAAAFPSPTPARDPQRARPPRAFKANRLFAWHARHVAPGSALMTIEAGGPAREPGVRRHQESA